MNAVTSRIGLRLVRKALASITNASRTAQFRRISAYGYEQAKALVYSEHGEPEDVLKLHGHSISPAHSSLVTIQFLASSINPADINTVQGRYPSQPPLTTALSTKEPSAVPGNEGVARVVAAGASAEDAMGQKLNKGDWVLMKSPGVGTWRTHAQAEGNKFIKLDEADREGITELQAGTVSINPCTAYAMLKSVALGNEPIQPGQWFVQNAANSGVGRAAIQLGRDWGLKSINIIRSRPGGEEETKALKDELRSLGADIVVTDEEASDKSWNDFVKSTIGDGGSVPLALNGVGGRSALNLCKALSPSGRMFTYGGMSKQPVSFPVGLFIFKDLKAAGFWVSRWADQNPQDKSRAVREILSLTRQNKFKDGPVVEVEWKHTTKEGPLLEAIQGTLSGFRAGKGVFVFKDT